MAAYYNEFEPYAADWLRNLIKKGLIADGEVDTRSVVDVRADDLRGFTQCHFFAGLGGWSYACRLAGWPDTRPIWTGSCPCQPFSVAGRGEGQADERHLWPEWFRLIRECRPDTILGEQVAAAIGKDWLDGVCVDLEGEGYACGPVVLPACAVDAPHRRDRLWFVAMADATCVLRNGAGNARPGWRNEHSDGGVASPLAHSHQPFASEGREQRSGELGGTGGDPQSGDVGHAIGAGLEGQPRHGDDGREPGWLDAQSHGSTAEAGCSPVEHSPRIGWGEGRSEPEFRGGRPAVAGASLSGSDVADAIGSERHGRTDQPERGSEGRAVVGRIGAGAWHNAGWIIGSDGKARRVESGIRLLAHGVSGRVDVRRAAGQGGSEAQEEVHWYNRVGALRGLGNAIVPQVAAELIRAVMDQP